jgi:hypothetical protein
VEHRHFCDVGAGHYFQCDGLAMRPFDSTLTACFCPDCGVLMTEGDHGKCAGEVEHFPCPVHLREHLVAHGYDPDNLLDPSSPLSILALFSDQEGYPIFNWCRWCSDSFRLASTFREHQADLMNNCPAFAEFRNSPSFMEFLEAMEEWDEGMDDIEF